MHVTALASARVHSCAQASTSNNTRQASRRARSVSSLSRATRPPTRTPLRSPRASAEESEGDLVERYGDALRASPAAFGATSGLILLANRALSGVAPVADASSAQSRADVICLAMSACLVLTGFTWIALKTKPPNVVDLVGPELETPFLGSDARADDGLRRELLWSWKAAGDATNCDVMAVFKLDGTRVFQAGKTANALAETTALQSPTPLGPICDQAIRRSAGNYLANLILFPGRVEFEAFFPVNTQAVYVTPIGVDAVLVVGSRTQRGFTPNDQRWFAVLAQKLDRALESSSGSTGRGA